MNVQISVAVGRLFARLGFSRGCLRRLSVAWGLLAAVLILAPAVGHAQITQIVDSTGDGTNGLDSPGQHAATDAAGNLYVTGFESDNAFKVTPGGTITQIIDSTSDGTHTLNGPTSVAVDGAGNAFVSGALSHNVFQITPGGTITEIIDSTGDGTHALSEPRVEVASAGNVYVVGRTSSNAFKIAVPGTCSTGGTPCSITQIIDSTGDGTNVLSDARAVATDAAGNVFVAGETSDNVFKIAVPGTCSTGGTPCTITEIIDSTGDGANDLDNPTGIVADGTNVYVTASRSDNVLRIEAPGTCSTGGTPCTITEIIDSTGDGTHPLDLSQEAATDAAGNVYVTGTFSDNAFKIDTPGGCSTGGSACTIAQIIDSTGDGTHAISFPVTVAAGSGNVFIGGQVSDNIFCLGACVDATTAPEVDIKPGSVRNPINPFTRGLIPVAILGSESFDVMDVDPDTLAFGPSGAGLAHSKGPHYDNVDGDGFTDLLAHFRTQDAGIGTTDPEACLTWENDDGTAFEACDDITIVGRCGIGFELALLLPPLVWLSRRRRP
jgi:hypothetical protein